MKRPTIFKSEANFRMNPKKLLFPLHSPIKPKSRSLNSCLLVCPITFAEDSVIEIEIRNPNKQTWRGVSCIEIGYYCFRCKCRNESELLKTRTCCRANCPRKPTFRIVCSRLSPICMGIARGRHSYTNCKSVCQRVKVRISSVII